MSSFLSTVSALLINLHLLCKYAYFYYFDKDFTNPVKSQINFSNYITKLFNKNSFANK